mmetsp:Transcript_34475/g.83412  ORF Transcript_34475/g.83412 Transcript_34475/m.83412 type:complete len:200 (+) Transcript_34475:63-662(+)
MKFAITHAALFLANSAAAKQGIDIQAALSLAIAEHQTPVSGIHSFMSVGVGDACDDEMIALNKDSNLVAAAGDVGSCPTSQSGNTATIDGSACPAMGRYAIACTAAGGKTMNIPSATIRCTHQGQEIRVVMKDVNECHGKSCNLSVDQYANDMAKELEQIFAAQGTYMSCSGGSSGAKRSSGRKRYSGAKTNSAPAQLH